jgi:hypothetical protein
MPLHIYNLLDEELHVTTDTRIDISLNFAPNRAIPSFSAIAGDVIELGLWMSAKVQ